MSGGPRDLTTRMGAGAAQVEVVDGSSVVGPAFQGPLAQKLARGDIEGGYCRRSMPRAVPGRGG